MPLRGRLAISSRQTNLQLYVTGDNERPFVVSSGGHALPCIFGARYDEERVVGSAFLRPHHTRKKVGCAGAGRISHKLSMLCVRLTVLYRYHCEISHPHKNCLFSQHELSLDQLSPYHFLLLETEEVDPVHCRRTWLKVHGEDVCDTAPTRSWLMQVRYVCTPEDGKERR